MYDRVGLSVLTGVMCALGRGKMLGGGVQVYNRVGASCTFLKVNNWTTGSLPVAHKGWGALGP